MTDPYDDAIIYVAPIISSPMTQRWIRIFCLEENEKNTAKKFVTMVKLDVPHEGRGRRDGASMGGSGQQS